MGLSYRKSISAGPFRFNLSGSGIGVSVGMPGFRVGTGPRGNYVSISKGGFTYRATLPSSGVRLPASPQPTSRTPAAGPIYTSPATATVGPMMSVASATADQLTSSSLDSLVDEINRKAAMMPLWPWCAALALVSVVFAILSSDGGLYVAFASGALATAVCVASIWAYYWDVARRSTVLFYDLDATSEQAFSSVIGGLTQLAASAGKWRINAAGRVLDSKYHAGASSVVQRKSLQLGIGPFSKVKCNLDVPYIVAGANILYFCPDRLFVVTGHKVAAIRYDDLNLRDGSTQFIEEEGVPGDAVVVGRTWRYVNKSGGPDRRFKDNQELPVVRYDEISLTSASGLNEIFQFSKPGVAAAFCQSARSLLMLRPAGAP
ncbi:TPA: DUF4236 domain-containing protein [Burkholderia cepacia ATCC 25416]|nr:DUF4236 domain-containing protein [Burkholderia cepacia ATCC 25416]HDR9774754.1 DUF4236 domain-containing protein [Burkholderia cepacia ATCC 25416]HDR9783712.1 DUF4236 domain-containing protein [Burkholderia cepacia ATCC 25416]HDR9792634.1 DUF4236 domain-containing protein [Burkholderia cepacia ATCC 25416]